MFAGTATLSDTDGPGDTSFFRRLHSHDLPCVKEPGQVAILKPETRDHRKTLCYLSLFNKSNEVPETLGGLCSSALSA